MVTSPVATAQHRDEHCLAAIGPNQICKYALSTEMVDCGYSGEGLYQRTCKVMHPGFPSPSPSSFSGLQKVDSTFASHLIGTSGAGPQECGARWGYKSRELISDS